MVSTYPSRDTERDTLLCVLKKVSFTFIASTTLSVTNALFVVLRLYVLSLSYKVIYVLISVMKCGPDALRVDDDVPERADLPKWPVDEE